MIIDFDGILIRYTKSDLPNINLGYVITVHKCITKDSYIYTNKGIIQLNDLIELYKFDEDGYADITDDLLVYNGKYLEKPNKLIDNGSSNCKTLITKKGYNKRAKKLRHKLSLRHDVP